MFKTPMMSKQRPVLAWLLAAVLTLSTATSAGAAAGYSNPGPHDPADTSFAGAYIIDAGATTGTATTQTINQGLKPYGLIYALVKAKVPVEWIIKNDKVNPTTKLPEIDQVKGNNGIDFTFDCDGIGATYAAKDYKTGAFVIPADFSLQAKPIIDSWKANSANAGLVVDGPCSNTTPVLPIFATITSWPRAILDTQNGKVAVDYFNNAGFPTVSTTAVIDPANPPVYRFASPSQLTPCDDIYVMPHADPTWATHKDLLPFVKSGGSFYASCHAVSEVENMLYPADYTDVGLRGKLAMNFLSSGNVAQNQALVKYGSHVEQGTLPYNFYKPSDPSAVDFASSSGSLERLRVGDPIAQFLGTTDAATQAGSEQIFIPYSGSKWRSTTQIVTYDQTQRDASAQGTGPASSVLYGPAFGDTKNGWVMYEGGHSLNKGTAGDVAAQRAFFNFLLLTAIDRRPAGSTEASRAPIVNVVSPAPGSAISSGSSVPVKGAATGGSGSYSYKWSATCFNAAKQSVPVADTAFSPSAEVANATFTAPDGAAGQVDCNLQLTVIDTCGRFAFGYSSVTFSQPADVRLAMTPVPAGTSHVSANADITYTLSVYNAGGTAGTNDGRSAAAVTVRTSVPAGAIFVSATPTDATGNAISGASCSESGGSVVCDLGNMADEITYKVIFKVKVNSVATSGSVIMSANASSKSADSDLTNNAVTVTHAKDAAGIKIVYDTKTVYVDANGSPVTYTYTVTNLGANPLSSVVVTDNKISGALTRLANSGIYGDLDSDNKLDTNEVWRYSATRTVSWATPDPSLTNDPTTRSSVATATGNDVSAGNVTSSDDAAVQIVWFAISATITPRSQAIPTGGNANVTLQVKNNTNQPVNIDNIDVWNVFTTGGTLACKVNGVDVTIGSTSATAYRISTLAQGATWTADCVITGPTLTEGQSGTSTINATASNPLAAGRIVTAEPATGTIAIATPKLTITKLGAISPLTRGQAQPYTITIKNTDTVTNDHVVLRDTPPDGMTLGPVALKYKSLGGTAHTYLTGVLANEKFYSSSSTDVANATSATGIVWRAGSAWSTSDGSNVTLRTTADTSSNNGAYSNEKYSVRFANLSSSPKTLTRLLQLNGDLAKDSTYLSFECSSYASTSSSNASKLPNLIVTINGTQVYNGKCSTGSSSGVRVNKVVQIPSSLLGTGAPSGGSPLVFSVASARSTSSSSSVLFLDDVTVISGLVAGHSFTTGLGSATSAAGGFGWNEGYWSKAGAMLANLVDQKVYGTDLEYKPNSSSSSAATATATRSFNLDVTNWQSAKLSFSCRHATFGTNDSFTVKVAGTTLFSETSAGTAKCAVGSNKENSKNIVIPIETAIATSTASIPVVIEMAGDQYIGIDDIYITSGPSGGASANADQLNVAWQLDPSDPTGKRYYVNIANLGVGEVVTATFTAAISATFSDAGAATISNTASVISTQQPAANATAATATTPFAVSEFALSKTVDVSKVLSGGSVTYTYAIKNNGDLSSTSNVIVDDNGTPDNTADDVTVSTVASASLVKSGGSGATATDGNLDPGESWTFTRTVSGVIADITDTATFTGATTDGGAPTDTDVTTVLVVAPSVSMTVDRTTHYIRTGETAEFYYTVTNTGNDPLIELVVTPPYCKTFAYASGDLDSDGVLDGVDGEHLVAESWVYKCVTDVLTTDQTGGSATVSATSKTFGSSVNGTPISITITVIAPALSITKVATNTAATQAGSTSAFSNVDPTNSVNRKVVDPSNSVDYTYVVTNTGDASLTGVSIVDSDCANPVYPSGKSVSTTMAPAASWTFTCDAVTKTQSVRGIAYANALDPMLEDVQSNAVSLYIKVLAPHLLLNVTSATEYVKYGSSTTFTYTVTNDGEVEVGGFDIVPGVCSPLVGPVQGAGSTNANLEIGEVWTYTCTMSNITSDPLNTFEISNVKDGGGASTGYTPAPSVVRVFVVDPTMTVVQQVSVYAAGVLMAGPSLDVPAELGDTIKYTYEIASSNTVHGSSISGLNTMLINSITDAQCSPIQAVDADNDGFNDGDTNTDGQVDRGETWVFSCSTTQPTQTAQVVDAQATVSAASVVESFTLRPASVRVRVAGALPVAPPSGGSYTTNGPGLAPDIQAPPGTYAKKLTLKVYFKGDSAKLIAATKAKIAAFVKKVKAAGGTPTISVIGKVKETVDKSYDIRLSTQRAVAVAKEMKRLKALGTYKTIAAGISPENKAISRRVEITAIWPKTATK